MKVSAQTNLLADRKRKASKSKCKSRNSTKKQKKSRSIKVEPPHRLPIHFKNDILKLTQGRTVSQKKLVIQRNRLNIPWKQMREEFLTKEEKNTRSKSWCGAGNGFNNSEDNWTIAWKNQSQVKNRAFERTSWMDLGKSFTIRIISKLER